MRILRLTLFLVPLIAISCTPEMTNRSNQTEAGAEVLPASFIHEDFDFTEVDLEQRLPGLSPNGRENPGEFLEDAGKLLDLPPVQLTLVDKMHPLPADFVPRKLVALSEYPSIITSRPDMLLNEDAAEALARLCEAAAEEDIRLIVSSAYRSYEYQSALFDRYAQQDGEEAASRYSARPGTSQHQLGSTVDFGDISNLFASSEEGEWMKNNAAGYGWSLSYPEGAELQTGYMWESWHWRWIGTEAASIQKRWFGDSQQKFLEFWASHGESIEKARVSSD